MKTVSYDGLIESPMRYLCRDPTKTPKQRPIPNPKCHIGGSMELEAYLNSRHEGCGWVQFCVKYRASILRTAMWLSEGC